MAFVSLTYDSYDRATDQYFYTLVDSEFGSVKVEGDEDWVTIGAAGGAVLVVALVAKEYIKRGLPVGRNLALVTICTHRTYKSSIADIVRWQDEYCPEYVENWQLYARERDEHLNKLLALT
jgi:hypothetical protein